MTNQVNIPKELMDEINTRHPFPWVQYSHPNGLIQVGDKNNREVDIFLLIKTAIAVSQGVQQ
jgi:hypothetical protein